MSDTTRVSVGPKGRVVIPVDIRRRLGLLEGTELVAMVEGEGVLLVPRSAVKATLRNMFSGVSTSMSADLISDRRAAAERESQG